MPKQLNKDFLQAYYQDMGSEVGLVFEMFLTEIRSEVAKIHQLISENNFDHAWLSIHMIEPSFTLVGLPQLTTQIGEIGHLLKDGNNMEVQSLFHEFSEEFNAYLPAIEEEYHRLMSNKKVA